MIVRVAMLTGHSCDDHLSNIMAMGEYVSSGEGEGKATAMTLVLHCLSCIYAGVKSALFV